MIITIQMRNEEPMGIDHIRPQRNVFLCHKEGHLARHTMSRLVNAIAQVMKLETCEVCCWRCEEVSHLKRRFPQKQ